jgi:hypothetical protein
VVRRNRCGEGADFTSTPLESARLLGCLLVQQRSGSTECDRKAAESLTEKPYFSDDESTNPFTFVFTYEAKSKRTKLPGALICIQPSEIKKPVSLRMAEACPVAIFSWRLLDFESNLPTND